MINLIQRPNFYVRVSVTIEATLEEVFENVMQKICEASHLTKYDILRYTRKRENVYWRYIAMYIIWRKQTFTNCAIGRAFNNRDHTMVIYAVQQINNFLDKKDPLVCNMIKNVRGVKL